MWSNPQKTADLVTFTEEILNGKLHFFLSKKWFLAGQYIVVYKLNTRYMGAVMYLAGL